MSAVRQQSPYSRDNPSPRYRALIQQYQSLHTRGAPEQGVAAQQMFPGQSLLEHVAPLVELCRQLGVRRMLDYGCGKAMLYRPGNNIEMSDGRTFTCLQELLDVQVGLYDPAYLPYSMRPQGRFDLVVCTDVLEHCSVEDVHWILDDLFGYAERFVYANIACYPAKKVLPNGENAHCTVQDVHWWQAMIAEVVQQYAAVQYRFTCTYGDGSQHLIASEGH